MRKNFIVIAAVVALLLSWGTVTAFAAESAPAAEPQAEGPAAPDTALYSYLTGQETSQGRNSVYAQAEQIESEQEREAYLEAQGVGETPWSEEAAASFSYVGGRTRGSSYRSEDPEGNANGDMGSYSYVTGQQRGSSYHK